MNTIRNYLENMFLNLPNTPEVIRAKEELLQMMEDRYSELIAEGRAENEAVGVVISEFGNLDEIAQEIGIEKIVNHEENVEAKRIASLDEVKTFLRNNSKWSYGRAFGVFLVIICSVPIIVLSGLAREGLNSLPGGNEGYAALGVVLLFVCIAAGVGLIIWSSLRGKKWNELKNCALDFATMEYVKSQRENFRMIHTMSMVLGVVLCIMCSVPAAVLHFVSRNSPFIDTLGGALVLVMVGVAVFLFVSAGCQKGGYMCLLGLGRHEFTEDNRQPSNVSDDEEQGLENSHVSLVANGHSHISHLEFPDV